MTYSIVTPKFNYAQEIRRYNFPKELQAELVALFIAHNDKPVRKRYADTPVGYKTMYRRFVDICATFRTLKEIGYPIQFLANFKVKHVQALFTHWEKQGDSIGTIENKLSYLRMFLRWIGKHNMIGPGKTFSADPDNYRRTTVAQTDKTWTGNGIDILAKIEEIRRCDPVVALQMELQMAFGLRAEESMLLRPKQALIEATNKLELQIVHGTKGGRLRQIQLDDIVQLDVLTRAASAVPEKYTTLIPAKYTLEQWRAHYYYVCRKFNIKKSTEQGGLGVTCHGLRHEYLNRLFERITGKPSPIQGGADYDEDLYQIARKMVAERAGHCAPEKSGAYLGSKRGATPKKPVIPTEPDEDEVTSS